MNDSKVEFNKATINGASFFVKGSDIILVLSAQEMFDTIKLLQKALFEWHELTGNKIDEGNPT